MPYPASFGGPELRFDLYAWKEPRKLETSGALELVQGWEAAGGDPAASPFEPSSDVGDFFKELSHDLPGLEVASDGRRLDASQRGPAWLATEPEPPARVAAMRLSGPSREDVETIYGLATKYDLVLFEPRTPRLWTPMAEMAAYASATFWPRGAIRAAVAGGLGGLVALGAWLASIPIVSGVVALGGGFMFVMAIWTFVHEGRVALQRHRDGGP